MIDQIDTLPSKLPDELSTITRGAMQLQWSHVGHAGRDSFTMFATEQQLELMRNARILCLDGTFNSAPAPFTQILVVNAVVGGHSYPCAHMLLASKHAGAYAAALQVCGRLNREPKKGTPLFRRPSSHELDALPRDVNFSPPKG